MYKGIKLSCSLNSSLSLKTECKAFKKPRTNKWPYCSFHATSEQNCFDSDSRQDKDDFCLPKSWWPLNSDYSARITTVVKVI